MNLLDRLIAALAPEAGLRRARARAQIGAVRSYDGAQRNRRTTGWRTSNAGPITEVRAGRAMLRDRSRDLVRNNPWASAALDVRVAYEVGYGIEARSATGDEALDRQVDTAWARWCGAADLSRRLNFDALVAQEPQLCLDIGRTVTADGDVGEFDTEFE
jgi:capsid protein